MLSEFGTPEFAAEFADAHKKCAPAAAGSFDEAISLYLASPKFMSLKERTRIEYRSLTDTIREMFGTAKAADFNRSMMRQLVYKWRDQFSDTPRKADHLVAVLSGILTYLVDQSRLERNVLKGMKKLYRSNRAQVVWSDDEIARVCEHASPQLVWAIRFAALTGLRSGDLISLPWSSVQANCIQWRASKNEVDILIPITSDIRVMLEEIPKRSTTILTNTKGRPWTSHGLKTVWGRAVEKSGIRHKHFHDLRGTAATKFCLADLSDGQIAAIIGWKPTRVAEIRARYVDRQMIVQGVIDQLEKNKDRTETVNRAVNRGAN